MFKSNFLLWIVVDLAWFGLSLAFIQFLYLQVNTIAGWTKWEMILLVATNNLMQQIFQTFLMINCTNLPELVRTGKLDFFLAQPASPQFLVSTRKFEPGSVVSCAVAIVVCGVAIAHLPMHLSWLGSGDLSGAGRCGRADPLRAHADAHVALVLDDARAGIHQRLLQRLPDRPAAARGVLRPGRG